MPATKSEPVERPARQARNETSFSDLPRFPSSHFLPGGIEDALEVPRLHFARRVCVQALPQALVGVERLQIVRLRLGRNDIAPEQESIGILLQKPHPRIQSSVIGHNPFGYLVPGDIEAHMRVLVAGDELSKQLDMIAGRLDESSQPS